MTNEPRYHVTAESSLGTTIDLCSSDTGVRFEDAVTMMSSLEETDYEIAEYSVRRVGR